MLRRAAVPSVSLTPVALSAPVVVVASVTVTSTTIVVPPVAPVVVVVAPVKPLVVVVRALLGAHVAHHTPQRVAELVGVSNKSHETK